MATICELTQREVQGLCQRYWTEEKTTPTTNDDNEAQCIVNVINYSLRPTSDAPAGFLGCHQYLDVEISIKDANQNERVKKLRFFSKTAPVEIESRMQYLDGFGVFKKEIAIYSEILPQIQRIFPGIAPKLYYAANNLLVFEDLARQGYKMGSSRDTLLDYQHLNCALKGLASLHAGSLVFEIRQGKKLNEMFADTLKENAYPSGIPEDHVRRRNFVKAISVMREIIKTIPKYSGCVLDDVLEKLQPCMETIFEDVKIKSKYRNVLLHGDLWSNNIMFQYEKKNGNEIPKQCRLVDFQLARYGAPFLDVLTLLTIPTTRKFREQYLDKLLNDYYQFMSEFLKYEGLAIDDFYTKDQYAQGVSEFRLFGLIESCLFSHLTILPSSLTNELTGSATGFEDFFDEKRIEICMKAFRTDEIYNSRMTDMIEDLVDRYILN